MKTTIITHLQAGESKSERQPERNYEQHGFDFLRNCISLDRINRIRTEILWLSGMLGGPADACSIDEAWNFFKVQDRRAGALIYNAFKRLPAVHSLCAQDSLIAEIKKITGFALPAILDVNCRIDSQGEERYLFDWHQDYWFSVSSTNALVVWIPLEKVDEETGGIELYTSEDTQHKILKTSSGIEYNTYADAVRLAEDLPTGPTISTFMDPGDALLFKFNILHRSKPVLSKNRSRFTIQFRYADFADPQFIANEYKPGIVTNTKTSYFNIGK